VIQYRKKRLILVERFGRNGLWQCRVADRADACMNVDLSMEGVCLSGTRRERGRERVYSAPETQYSPKAEIYSSIHKKLLSSGGRKCHTTICQLLKQFDLLFGLGTLNRLTN